MKVAAIFLGMPVGGAEDLAIGLARELRPRGIETHFVCLRSLDVLGEELAAADFPVTLLPAAKTKRFSPSGLNLLVDWLRQEKINLVHSHTYHAHTYAIPAARRLGLPVLLHHHKTLEKMKWHRWWTMRGLTRRATRVLALSEKTAADLRRSFSLSSDKVTALPNAVNETEFHPLPREQKLSLRAGLDLDSGAFIFLTVASLQEVKNHRLLLAAAEAAAPELSNCGFYCLGDGPERPILLERASLLPHHTTFHFPGAMRPVAPWLQCADAFVLPSVWEGQSLALLQAIRCGLPVLASRIEGNTALLGSSHPGLFSPVDPTELARLLTKLRLDAGFQKELLAAQSRLPLPSWTELASQIENIYRGEFSRFF